MLLNMIGADGETETTIKLKLWPIISLIIAGMVALGVYISNHESRLCVNEKAVETTEKALTASAAEMNKKIDKVSRDQDLFFSLREPRWKEWKAWDEKRRKSGGDE